MSKRIHRWHVYTALKSTDLDQYAKRVERAFTLQQEKIELPLIYEVLSHDIAVESGE